MENAIIIKKKGRNGSIITKIRATERKYCNFIQHIPEHKATHNHQPEGVHQSAGGKDQLANHQDEHVDNGAHANAEYTADEKRHRLQSHRINTISPNCHSPIDQKAARKAQHHIWPRVDRVQHHELLGGQVQVLLKVVLQRARIVIAEVGACNEQANVVK